MGRKNRKRFEWVPYLSLKQIDDYGAIESLREFINQVVTANKLKFGFDLYTIYKDDETGKVYGLIHTC